MRMPNFFIVGAPKCGTTALSEYLRGHSNIFVSTPKEPHFFATDFPKHRYRDEWSTYLQLFENADIEHAAVGEASALYLYSSEAIPAILRAFPEARFVVLLRDQVQLAMSMHAQCVFDADETVRSFEEAWKLCAVRRAGRQVPRSCRDVKIIQYDRIAMLGEQLQRLLAVVPSGQVRWWFLEDMRADTGRVYREVLAFLGLQDDRRTDFPIVNGRKRPRNQLLAKVTQKTPESLIRMARSLHINRIGGAVIGGIRRWNTESGAPGEVSPAMEAELREFFSQDVRLLHSLTNRPLPITLPHSDSNISHKGAAA
jgi:hypothetical protein